METDPLKTESENASAEAIHKAKNAQAAIEVAREAQMLEMVEKTAQRTKESLLEGLKEVFADDNKDPEQMKVLVQRIPILCTSVLQMHADIAKINENLTWGVRIVLGAVIMGVMALLFK